MKHNFPFIAVGMGLLMLLAVLKGKELDAEGATLIPLLTLLAINEVAFAISAVGAFVGIKRLKADGVSALNVALVVMCGILMVCFAVLGFELFPD